MGELGKWALIDLETTGSNPAKDDVIEVGFLRFEGLTLVESYQSLVRRYKDLPPFIQKLTGITPSMLAKAPTPAKVKSRLKPLIDCTLIAHNASFDRSFLPSLKNSLWEDSIAWLGLLFPHYSSLKLESFLKKWNLADKEQHRGLDDAKDLLKVLISAATLTNQDESKKSFLLDMLLRGGWEGRWFTRFLQLEDSQLQKVADQIDFDRKRLVSPTQSSRSPQVGTSARIDSHKFQADNIVDIYRSSLFPGYVRRQSQEDLALRVGQSFGNDVHALIQAPTGTGKTLGYLIPAALFALNKDKPVLISTGTKALQKQAMEKDIPLLQELLSDQDEKSSLRVERLVGSSNHLCELLFSNDREKNFLFEQDWDMAFGNLYLQMVFFHNTREPLENQVLRDDIPWVLKKAFPSLAKQEQQIAVDFRSCSGHRCPLRYNCSYHRNLQAAKDADIIIGNHALMFSWPKGFPRPSHIVVDEAHKIEDEATGAFSLKLEQHALQNFAKSLEQYRGIGALFFLISQTEENPELATSIIEEIKESILPLAKKLEENIEPLEELIGEYVQQGPRYTPDYWNALPLPPRNDSGGNLAQSLYQHWENIHALLAELSDILNTRYSLIENEQSRQEKQSEARTTFETFLANLDDLHEPLDWLLTRKPDYSYSIEYHLKQGYALNIAPINVGKEIHDRLLEISSSVVFTSATLGNATDPLGSRGVEWVTGHSYLPSTKRFQKGLFLLPFTTIKTTPRFFFAMIHPHFFRKISSTTPYNPSFPLLRPLRGAACSFTVLAKDLSRPGISSRKHLKERFPSSPKAWGGSVVEDFKSVSKGILLGMESFGEGIDIPGNQLQFMFIDKIPDLRQDPVIQDRRRFYNHSFGNEFTDYFLSHRTRALHQKLGRLIRKESDLGGAIVVDARVKKWKSRTREQFTQMMNPYQLQYRPLDEACHKLTDFLTKHPQLTTVELNEKNPFAVMQLKAGIDESLRS